MPGSTAGKMPAATPLYFFLMEFVDGVNLRQLLAQGRVSPREALAIVPQICDALQFAHDQGIVHRDIKPENILLDRRGRVKVADFGLAKIVGSKAPLTPSLSPSGGERVAKPGEGSPVLTEAGKVMGTPQYMSPEQIQAPGEVDHRADIYALGVVFYQMLTGELPGKTLEPPSRKVQVDVRLDDVVLRALEKKPELRYQQASALKTEVETIATEAPSTPGAPAVFRPPLRPLPFKSAFRLGLAMLLLTIVVSVVLVNLMTDSYRATARVLVARVIPSDQVRRASQNALFVPPHYDPYAIQNELEILQSEAVLGSVVSNLDLPRVWGKKFAGGPIMESWQALWILRRGLEVTPVRNSELIAISCYSDEPKEAATLANAVAASYRAYHAEKLRNYQENVEAKSEEARRSELLPALYQISFVENAQPPLRPARPNRPATVAAGVVLGLFLGLVVFGLRLLWALVRRGRGAPGETGAPSQGGLASSLPPRWFSYDARTKRTFAGVPLVHVTWGINPRTGQPAVARGIVAVGPVAQGVIATGLEAHGVFPVGLLAFGLAPAGLLSLGLFSSGMVAFGFEATGLVALASDQASGLFALAPFRSAPLVCLGVLAAALLAGRLLRTAFASVWQAAFPSEWLSASTGELAQGAERQWFARAGAMLWPAALVLLVFATVPFRSRWQPALQSLNLASAPAQAAASDRFREYPVNRSWTELARQPAADSPEAVLARFILGMLDGDPATTMSRYIMDLTRLPAGSANLNTPEGDRRWARQNKPPKVIVYRDELAAVFVPQQHEGGFATVVMGKRKGQWKLCSQADLPHAQTLAEAERNFREKAEETYTWFQGLPDQPPALIEEAGKALATNMGEMMGAMLSTVTQVVSQLPSAAAQVQHMAEDFGKQMDAQLSGRIAPQAGATNAARSGLEFRWVADDNDTNSPADLLSDERQQTLRVLKPVVLDNRDVWSAAISGDRAGTKEISVVLTSTGGKKFRRATASNIGRRLAIIWQGRAISAPVIQSAITDGRVSISGNFTDTEAQHLVDVLNHRNPKATGPRAEAPAGSLRLIGAGQHLNLVLARSESVTGYPLHEVVARFAGPALTPEQWQRARGAVSGPVLAPSPNEALGDDWRPEPASELTYWGDYEHPADRQPSCCCFACPNECQLQFALADEAEATEAAKQVQAALSNPVPLRFGKRVSLFRVGEREAWLEVRPVRPVKGRLAFVTSDLQHAGQSPVAGRSPVEPLGTNRVDSAALTVPPQAQLSLVGQLDGHAPSTTAFSFTITNRSDQPGLYWLSWRAGSSSDALAPGWEVFVHDARTTQQLQHFASSDPSGPGWRADWYYQSATAEPGEAMEKVLLINDGMKQPGNARIPSGTLRVKMVMRPPEAARNRDTNSTN
jgi:capsular polysaccharide biosynthesis protein